MVEPLRWSSPDDTPLVWARFERDGLCWVRMADAVELAQSAPVRLVERLCGTTPLVVQVNQIKVVAGSGRRSYAVTNDDAKFHVDQHPYLPPQLQILVCVQQASDPGGESLFLDTWRILAELRRRGSPLFEQLFETQRVIRFHNFAWCAPTFSMRARDLVCVHNGFPRGADGVGTQFQRLLDALPATRFRLETGDLLISNNHRTLHARTAFADTRRHLIRILSWLDRPLGAPAELAARAADVAIRTERRACDEPLWIRKRLGLSGWARGFERYDGDDLLAHYRGELVEDPGQLLQLLAAHGRATNIQLRSTPELAAR